MLRREHLQDRLNTAAPVTVVRGSRGYGKTSLVSAWLHETDPAVVTPIWITATAELARREDLLAHLNRQLRDAGLVSQDSDPSTGGFGELDDAMRTLPAQQSVVIVLDNGDNVEDHSLLEDLVGLVQRHAKLSLVFCSLNAHPIEQWAVGRVTLNRIRARELLLTSADVAALADRMGVRISKEAATRLHDVVGGWLVPIRLVLARAPKNRAENNEPPREFGDLQLEPATDYLRALAREALDQGGNIAKCLLYLGLTDRLAIDVASELARSAGVDPDQLLQRAESTGLVRRRAAGSQLELVLPELLQSSIREAVQQGDPGFLRTAHQEIARGFAASGPEYAHLAVHHAFLARDLALAREVLSDHGLEIGVMHSEVFRETLATVPIAELTPYPGLQVVRDLFRAPDDDSGSDADGYQSVLLTYYERCAQAVGQGIDQLELADLLALGAGHLTGLRLVGKLTEAADAAATINRRIGQLLRPDTRMYAYRAWFELHRGLTYVLLGEPARAITFFLSAWNYGTQAPPPFVPAQAAGELALIYTVRGDDARATMWLDRYRTTVANEPDWIGYLAGMAAHLAMALRAIDRLDEDTARAELARFGDGSAPVEHWPWVVFINAQFGLQFGNPTTTLANLETAANAHDQALREQGSTRLLLLRARADLLTASGLGQRAARMISEADERLPWLAIPAVRIHLLAGRYAQARTIAGEALLHTVTHSERLQLTILDAVAALRMEDLEAATASMTMAIDSYRESGILRAFVSVPLQDRDQLAALVPNYPGAARVLEGVYPDTLLMVKLTNSERVLLTALAQTASRREIAQQLFVTHNTVKTRLARLYRKLGVTTRDEALLRAAQLGP